MIEVAITITWRNGVGQKAESGSNFELLGLRDQMALARAPRRKRAAELRDVAGKIWAAPNTAIGLAVGGVGYLAGQAHRLFPGDQRDPHIRIGHNAIEFANNPTMPLGAMTLGNASIYGGDPYDPSDPMWATQDHERQHTIQSQQLGPFYLPSNIAGGLNGALRDGDWHGPSNWNEVGPQTTPAAPWPKRRR